MRLYIIRHGKAERDSATGRDDDRDLTPVGERQARRLGQWLAAHSRRPELVLFSPVKRARRTAELILESLWCQSAPEPRLATGMTPSDVMRAVQASAVHGTLAIVGHNPHFEDLVAMCLGGPGARFELRTGHLVALELDPLAPLAAATLVEQERLDAE